MYGRLLEQYLKRWILSIKIRFYIIVYYIIFKYNIILQVFWALMKSQLMRGLIVCEEEKLLFTRERLDDIFLSFKLLSFLFFVFVIVFVIWVDFTNIIAQSSNAAQLY